MPIIGTLPYTLTNGTLANADEVMADFNAIVSQVNTNALPSGGALTAGLEWTLLSDAPVYVSATSFTMTGDQTATFTIGRRVKSVNTGGTTYSTVTASSVILDTTVTVTNSSGTLDSGMSAVSIATLDAVNQSLPVITRLFIPGLLTATITSNVDSPLGLFTVPAGDALDEWDSTSGFFIPKYAGYYLVSAFGYVTTSGANITAGMRSQINAVITGGTGPAFGAVLAFEDWPYAAGVQSTIWNLGGQAIVNMTLGSVMQVNFFGATWGGGTPGWTGTIGIERILY